MTRTLQTLIDEHAARLPGREREREALLALVERDRPLFACVHGIGGIGKSALLRAFATDARARGARVLAFDGGALEPTERGFLDALGAAVGAPVGCAEDVTAALAGDARTVIVLDGYEHLWLLDAWIRGRLIPCLPAEARLVLAGREVPVAWRRSFGDLARFVRVDSLAPAAAQAVLARAGLPPGTAERVNRLAQGHPLALQLAAGALADEPELALEEAAARPLLEELAGRYLSGLDAPAREALDAACVVRRPTISLLAAMLPGASAPEAFERLRELPFVELGREGLVVHDTMRALTAALLRATEPAAARRYRAAAWAQLRRELREAEEHQLWRYTADMLYLVENASVRDAFFPGGGDAHAVEQAAPADERAIFALARGLDEPAAARLDAWWRAAPGAFRVARGRRGDVEGFLALLERAAVPHALYAVDPVAAAWREHLRTDPLPRGGRVLLVRWARAGAGDLPCPAMAALWLSVKRDYLELRPDLRRVYLSTGDPASLAPALAPLGFAAVPGTPAGCALLVNDFGPGSTDEWLATVVGRELEAAEQPLDLARRRLVLDGRQVDLTKLEWDTLAYLRAHEGRPVGREELLREVWGHEWTGGSNVVEVVVSSLRRKLGDRAGALATIRGVGYRLDPL